MAENSKIEWTHHTFNPWRGCTKVSDGCKHCYAETLSKRNPGTLGVWGPRGTRVIASDPQWRLPLKWNRAAAEAGERHRVFCASLADVFEGPDTMRTEDWPIVQRARRRLLTLIYYTPHLDWLLLTKRPEGVLTRLNECAELPPGESHVTADGLRAACSIAEDWLVGHPPFNVWLGTSIENQATADERIPRLLHCPAAVRFLSCEPLLGAVDLDLYRVDGEAVDPLCDECNDRHEGRCDDGINWVIVGGESGPNARPFDIAWAESLVEQCRAAGVACFVKQLGSNPIDSGRRDVVGPGGAVHYVRDVGSPLLAEAEATPGYSVRPERLSRLLNDKKGGDPSEWPEAIRVREFPQAMEVASAR